MSGAVRRAAVRRALRNRPGVGQASAQAASAPTASRKPSLAFGRLPARADIARSPLGHPERSAPGRRPVFARGHAPVRARGNSGASSEEMCGNAPAHDRLFRARASPAGRRRSSAQDLPRRARCGRFYEDKRRADTNRSIQVREGFVRARDVVEVTARLNHGPAGRAKARRSASGLTRPSVGSCQEADKRRPRRHFQLGVTAQSVSLPSKCGRLPCSSGSLMRWA